MPSRATVSCSSQQPRARSKGHSASASRIAAAKSSRRSTASAKAVMMVAVGPLGGGRRLAG
jgi:hypothetical protein